jgi:hypothetical protein
MTHVVAAAHSGQPRMQAFAAVDGERAAPHRKCHWLQVAIAVLATAAWMSASPVFAQANEVGIHVFGLSYHFQKDTAQELGVDNSVNPGLGARYRFAEYERWAFSAEGGVFKDSGRNTAGFIGASALWHAGYGFHLGGALVVMGSSTYNEGKPFLAPLPLVTYDFGSVTLNATYFPKISGTNEVAALGFFITLWPGRW